MTSTGRIERATQLLDGPKIHFVSTWCDVDDSYAPVSFSDRSARLSKEGLCVSRRKSLVLEGHDYEGELVSAIRKTYKTVTFPDTAAANAEDGEKFTGESQHTPKQLIGLPNFGARIYLREGDTGELLRRVPKEPSERRELLVHQSMFNEVCQLHNAKGPRQLCMALRDAIYGLLNIFRMGYVHRDITEKDIFIVERPDACTTGYMLSRDGKSLEGAARPFSGLLLTFSRCKKIGNLEPSIDDMEKIKPTRTTPLSLLSVEKRADIVHSPIFDLESIFWVLLSVATEIVNDYTFGRRKTELDSPEVTAAMAHKQKNNPSRTREEVHVRVGLPSSSHFKNTQDDETGTQELNSRDYTSFDVPGDNAGEETMAIDAETEMNTQHGLQPAEDAMDIDIDCVQIEQKQEMPVVHAESEDHAQTQVEDSESMTNEMTNPLNCEEHKEQKREAEAKDHSIEVAESKAIGETTSKEAKGSREIAAGTDDKKSTSEHDSDESSPDDDDLRLNFPSNLWHYDDSVGGTIFWCMKPLEFEAPPDFKPPEKPQYLAFAEDRGAYKIDTFLEPRDFLFPGLNRQTRLYLLLKLTEFLDTSHGLAPFAPLIKELSDLAYYLFKQHGKSKKVFSEEEIEDAFTLYLDLFEKYMPKEDDWLYMKWYEGPDVQLKFDRVGFLGAFASPNCPS